MSDVLVLPSTPRPYACKVKARTSRRRGSSGLDTILHTHTTGTGTAQLELPYDVRELSRLAGDLVGIVATLAACAETPR